ncbi:MAG: hypothetical protein RL033_1365 [Pseudomonadota bacterium]
MASVIPENQASFSHEELLEATGGSCEPFAGAGRGVWTDSRAELAGGVFVALPGERFDGHDFVALAVKRGALVQVVERDVGSAAPSRVLRVPSTLAALGDLAAFHRRRWGGRVLGVAGSVGKTTTRSSVVAVASAAGVAVHSPRGNLNNLIGVPMVLLGLGPEHELGVVEIGTNHTGEVARLAALAQPDVAVLTRIALEHAEGLGDLDAIEREEGDLLRSLRPGGIAVFNADDERCMRQAASCAGIRHVRYGLATAAARTGAEYQIVQHESLTPRLARVQIARPSGGLLALESPLLGLPGAYALTAAIAATEALLGRVLQPAELTAALASPTLGEPGRLSAVEMADGTLVLDDTYNSSPASVKSSALVARDLATQRGARLLLAIGEMRELGAHSRAAHRELAPDVAAVAPEYVVVFGGDASELALGLAGAGVPSCFLVDAPAALERLQALRQPGDVILVKASRGLRAERVVQGLQKEAARNAEGKAR